MRFAALTTSYAGLRRLANCSRVGSVVFRMKDEIQGGARLKRPVEGHQRQLNITSKQN
jgi:hypothetical protein